MEENETTQNLAELYLVWVKISGMWWVAEVQDQDTLDPEITEGLKKRPPVIVKFLNEDTYEHVRNGDNICSYNHVMKKEQLLKLGFKKYYKLKNEKNMAKFPEHIQEAERRTGGDPNIIYDPQYLPQEALQLTKAENGGRSSLPATLRRKKSSAPRRSAPGRSGSVEYSDTDEGSEDSWTPIVKKGPSWEAFPKFITRFFEPRKPPADDPSVEKPHLERCCMCLFETTDKGLFYEHWIHNQHNTMMSQPSMFRWRNKTDLETKKSRIKKTVVRRKKDSVAKPADKKPSKKSKKNLPPVPVGDFTPPKKAKMSSPSTTPSSHDVSQECAKIIEEWTDDDEEEEHKPSNDTVDEDLLNSRTAEAAELEKSPEALSTPPKANKPADPPKPSSCFDFDEEELGEPDLQSSGKFGHIRLPRVITPEKSKPPDPLDVGSDIDNLLNEVSVPEIPILPPTKHESLFSRGDRTYGSSPYKDTKKSSIASPVKSDSNTDVSAGDANSKNDEQHFLAEGPLQSKKRKVSGRTEGAEDGSASKKKLKGGTPSNKPSNEKIVEPNEMGEEPSKIADDTKGAEPRVSINPAIGTPEIWKEDTESPISKRKKSKKSKSKKSKTSLEEAKVCQADVSETEDSHGLEAHGLESSKPDIAKEETLKADSESPKSVSRRSKKSKTVKQDGVIKTEDGQEAKVDTPKVDPAPSKSASRKSRRGRASIDQRDVIKTEGADNEEACKDESSKPVISTEESLKTDLVSPETKTRKSKKGKTSLEEAKVCVVDANETEGGNVPEVESSKLGVVEDTLNTDMEKQIDAPPTDVPSAVLEGKADAVDSLVWVPELVKSTPTSSRRSSRNKTVIQKVAEPATADDIQDESPKTSRRSKRLKSSHEIPPEPQSHPHDSSPKEDSAETSEFATPSKDIAVEPDVQKPIKADRKSKRLDSSEGELKDQAKGGELATPSKDIALEPDVQKPIKADRKSKRLDSSEEELKGQAEGGEIATPSKDIALEPDVQKPLKADRKSKRLDSSEEELKGQAEGGELATQSKDIALEPDVQKHPKANRKSRRLDSSEGELKDQAAVGELATPSKDIALEPDVQKPPKASRKSKRLDSSEGELKGQAEGDVESVTEKASLDILERLTLPSREVTLPKKSLDEPPRSSRRSQRNRSQEVPVSIPLPEDCLPKLVAVDTQQCKSLDAEISSPVPLEVSGPVPSRRSKRLKSQEVPVSIPLPQSELLNEENTSNTSISKSPSEDEASSVPAISLPDSLACDESPKTGKKIPCTQGVPVSIPLPEDDLPKDSTSDIVFEVGDSPRTIQMTISSNFGAPELELVPSDKALRADSVTNVLHETSDAASELPLDNIKSTDLPSSNDEAKVSVEGCVQKHPEFTTKGNEEEIPSEISEATPVLKEDASALDNQTSINQVVEKQTNSGKASSEMGTPVSQETKKIEKISTSRSQREEKSTRESRSASREGKDKTKFSPLRESRSAPKEDEDAYKIHPREDSSSSDSRRRSKRESASKDKDRKDKHKETSVSKDKIHEKGSKKVKSEVGKSVDNHSPHKEIPTVKNLSVTSPTVTNQTLKSCAINDTKEMLQHEIAVDQSLEQSASESTEQLASPQHLGDVLTEKGDVETPKLDPIDAESISGEKCTETKSSSVLKPLEISVSDSGQNDKGLSVSSPKKQMAHSPSKTLSRQDEAASLLEELLGSSPTSSPASSPKKTKAESSAKGTLESPRRTRSRVADIKFSLSPSTVLDFGSPALGNDAAESSNENSLLSPVADTLATPTRASRWDSPFPMKSTSPSVSVSPTKAPRSPGKKVKVEIKSGLGKSCFKSSPESNIVMNVSPKLPTQLEPDSSNNQSDDEFSALQAEIMSYSALDKAKSTPGAKKEISDIAKELEGLPDSLPLQIQQHDKKESLVSPQTSVGAKTPLCLESIPLPPEPAPIKPPALSEADLLASLDDDVISIPLDEPVTAESVKSHTSKPPICITVPSDSNSAEVKIVGTETQALGNGLGQGFGTGEDLLVMDLDINSIPIIMHDMIQEESSILPYSQSPATIAPPAVALPSVNSSKQNPPESSVTSRISSSGQVQSASASVPPAHTIDVPSEPKAELKEEVIETEIVMDHSEIGENCPTFESDEEKFKRALVKQPWLRPDMLEVWTRNPIVEKKVYEARKVTQLVFTVYDADHPDYEKMMALPMCQVGTANFTPSWATGAPCLKLPPYPIPTTSTLLALATSTNPTSTSSNSFGTQVTPSNARAHEGIVTVVQPDEVGGEVVLADSSTKPVRIVSCQSVNAPANTSQPSGSPTKPIGFQLKQNILNLMKKAQSGALDAETARKLTAMTQNPDFMAIVNKQKMVVTRPTEVKVQPRTAAAGKTVVRANPTSKVLTGSPVVVSQPKPVVVATSSTPQSKPNVLSAAAGGTETVKFTMESKFRNIQISNNSPKYVVACDPVTGVTAVKQQVVGRNVVSNPNKTVSAGTSKGTIVATTQVSSVASGVGRSTAPSTQSFTVVSSSGRSIPSTTQNFTLLTGTGRTTAPKVPLSTANSGTIKMTTALPQQRPRIVQRVKTVSQTVSSTRLTTQPQTVRVRKQALPAGQPRLVQMATKPETITYVTLANNMVIPGSEQVVVVNKKKPSVAPGSDILAKALADTDILPSDSEPFAEESSDLFSPASVVITGSLGADQLSSISFDPAESDNANR